MSIGPEEKLLARPFRVQSTDEAGAFEGHGAIFNDLHQTSSYALDPDWKDRIMPGAFKKTLETHTRMGTLPAMLYMHERGNVVGAWHDMGEVGAGLHAKGQVAMSARTVGGASLHELMKMGALNALSIGFRVRQSTLIQDKKIREIQDVELNELSIVDVPGIPRARITDVKTGLTRIDMLERVLRDAGLSRREAKALLAKGFNALRDAEADDEPTTEPRDASNVVVKDESLANMLKEFAASLK